MTEKQPPESKRIKRKIDACQREKVQNIIEEAQAEQPRVASSELGEMEEKIRDSERKRLKLAEALHTSRDQLRRMTGFGASEEERAHPFGYFVAYGEQREEGRTAIIRHHGRLYEARINDSEDLPTKPKPKAGTFHQLRERPKTRRDPRTELRKGELLLLNNELHVMEPRGFDLISGSLGTVQQVLSNEKLLIQTVGDETILVTLAHPMMNVKILPGDNIEYDPDSLFVYGLLPKTSVDRLVLERVPDVKYEDIGGLNRELETIRDVIELPHLYPEYFREHRLIPPKGILFYGPPGCGKTLVAKAVANSLAQRIEEKTGEKGESYFLNVKGPELLNKYVGETEQAIRDLFARARNQAGYRTPVIIFFDEMDSLFRVRGSGISSDMESTIVPQFLAELDGLEALENVVVIGATNREDLIDPAVLRPGRLDRKIRIPRPDKRAAADIFGKYLTADLPLDECTVSTCGGPTEAVQWMVRELTEELFDTRTENALMEITYSSGSRKILYLKDLCSGAIIENIVNRAKFMAVKALIETGHRGIHLDQLRSAMVAEFSENEDLPSSSNPAEWYRIIGRSGERVVRIRSLREDRGEDNETERIEPEPVDSGDLLS